MRAAVAALAVAMAATSHAQEEAPNKSGEKPPDFLQEELEQGKNLPAKGEPRAGSGPPASPGSEGPPVSARSEGSPEEGQGGAGRNGESGEPAKASRENATSGDKPGAQAPEGKPDGMAKKDVDPFTGESGDLEQLQRELAKWQAKSTIWQKRYQTQKHRANIEQLKDRDANGRGGQRGRQVQQIKQQVMKLQNRMKGMAKGFEQKLRKLTEKRSSQDNGEGQDRSGLALVGVMAAGDDRVALLRKEDRTRRAATGQSVFGCEIADVASGRAEVRCGSDGTRTLALDPAANRIQAVSADVGQQDQGAKRLPGNSPGGPARGGQVQPQQPSAGQRGPQGPGEAPSVQEALRAN